MERHVRPSVPEAVCIVPLRVNFQIDIIQARAKSRNEPTINNEEIIEAVIAPMLFRILFTERTLSLDYVHILLGRLFNAP